MPWPHSFAAVSRAAGPKAEWPYSENEKATAAASNLVGAAHEQERRVFPGQYLVSWRAEPPQLQSQADPVQTAQTCKINNISSLFGFTDMRQSATSVRHDEQVLTCCATGIHPAPLEPIAQ